MAFFRRRLVWFPTWSGGLFGFTLLALIACALGVNAYALLAPMQPAREARTLVVEGWLGPGELQQVAAVVRAGRYERVVTTGGPIEAWSDVGGWGTAAARAAAYLASNGVPSSGADGIAIVAVPAPLTQQDRTYVTALMVRDWARRSGTTLGAIDLLSAGVHTRRSWLVYRMVLGPQVEVGAIAVPPADYDGERWWTSSLGVKATMGEVLSLAWTKCCFWPAASESGSMP